MAKKVSLPKHLYFALSKLAAKRDRSVDSLVEEIAGEWIRHTRALERRVGKSVFHVACTPAATSPEAAEPLVEIEHAGSVISKGGTCEQVDLDEQDPTVH